MPSATNPFSITFDGFAVGGATAYQLHGPYVFSKTHETLRLGFDVVVVGSSYADLQTQSNAVEQAFSKRLQTSEALVISLDGNAWTYTMGSTMLKCASEIVKSGNPEFDQGFSRIYTVAIQAELPATDSSGLRDIEVLVEHSSSRVRTVTMTGTYTAGTGGDAVAQYQANFPTEATAYLVAIDITATWELVNETYSMDRERDNASTNPHPNLCRFTRQYMELVANQGVGQLDDPAIRDHRISFTDLSQYPGDGEEGVQRMRRVVVTYDCAVDRTVTTDLVATYNDTVLRVIKQIFADNYQPQMYGVEDARVAYDMQQNRISAQLQFIYATSSSTGVVEAQYSYAVRETRTVDFTPLHDGQEFTANVDVGFTVRERIWNRTLIVLNLQPPTPRMAGSQGDSVTTRVRGSEGLTSATIPQAMFGTGGSSPWTGSSVGSGNGGVISSGTGGGSGGGGSWVTISNTSESRPVFIGDPAFGNQISATAVTETVIQQFAQAGGSAGSNNFQGYGSIIAGGFSGGT